MKPTRPSSDVSKTHLWAGSRDTSSRVRKKSNRILEEYEPEPLTREASQALNETLWGILERYEISLSSLPAI